MWPLLLLCLVCQLLAFAGAVPFGIPAPNKTQNCQYGVSLEWTTRVGSSVFATPAVVDLMRDGKKEILMPTFSQYLEALNGANGEDVPGYPFIHPRFKSYASPLPVDVDGDGNVEWLVATYTGELLLFNEEGKSRGLFKIPPLAVKKRWMDSRGNRSLTDPIDIGQLAAVRVNRSRANARLLNDILRARQMHDLYLYPADHGAAASGGAPGEGRNGDGDRVYSPPRMRFHTPVRGAQAAAVAGDAEGDPEVARLEAALGGGGTVRRTKDSALFDEDAELYMDKDDRAMDDDGVEDAPFDGTDNAVFWQEEDVGGFDDEDDGYDPADFYDGDERAYQHMPERENIAEKGIGPEASLSDEAKASMKLLFHPELYRAKADYGDEGDAFGAKHWRRKYTVSVLPDEVAVDAHILSTPRIVDIDGGGDLDIIVHVSYFFDAQQSSSPLFQTTELPRDVDPGDYVATAVVCMNLITGDLRWVRPLHLSTRSDPTPAYALSSPLVVNADRKDASLEVYVTSSTGSVVGLSSDGKVLPGWPVWLGPMAASPTAESLLGNDELNICVGDVEGKVKCLTSTGDVLWEKNVVGGVADHITYGDINGDGQIDVVFGTSAGLVYALDGSTGATLPFFPVVTRGSIVAPVLLLDLRRRRFGPFRDGDRPDSMEGNTKLKYPPLSLVVPSHDGNVYIIHGRDGCIETIDIDEKSSSMVLADDLTGNGHMDLLVTTINGGVYVFETATEYHPLKVWGSKTKGLNGNSASENNVGIYITPDYRRPRDVRGDKFRLRINIEDYRPPTLKDREYAVSVYVGTRTRVFRGVFRGAKEHRIQMRTPFERMYSSVTVAMTLPNGQVFTDVISLSFNMHFLSTIKYVLVIPFVCVCCALMFVHKRHEVELSH